jgi:hypothetical protein
MRVHGTKLGAISTGRGLGDQLYDLAGQVPSLDLNFAGTKTLDSKITFTRASSGTFVGSDGVLQTAATDVPRFDHNPTTGESLGLLVEEARTNLLVRSEEFNFASWNSLPGARTVTANQIVAPDGTTTADLVTADGTTASHSVSQSLTLSALPYSYSVFAKAGTNNFLQLRAFAAFGNLVANFNLATGVVGTASGTVTSSIQAYSNGWYRCTMVFTPTAATSSVGMFIVSSASAPSAEINSLSTSVYLWGAQLEAGAFPTSYIPTTTAAATRSADVASITGANFSSWYRQDEGTMFAEYLLPSLLDGTVFSFDDGTNDNRWQMRYRNSTGVNQGRYRFVSSSGSFDLTSSAAAPNVNTGSKSAYVMKSGDQTWVTNAIQGTQGTQSTVPAVTQLQLGNGAASDAAKRITIKRITYWPTRLTTLQAITQP